MTDLELRWREDTLFQFIYRMLLDPTINPTGMTKREWYDTAAPKTSHPTEGESLDCRGIDLSGLQVQNVHLGYVMDDGKAKRSVFEGTNLQNISAKRVEFTGSRFIKAQMSPIYAPQAIFRGCTFDVCYLMGIGPRDYSKGAFSDLRECDFTGVTATKAYFERCDLRKACFKDGKFYGCKFNQSDLQGIDFHGSQFEQCDFTEVQLDDTPTVRELIQQGNNTGTDRINWRPGLAA